jgi:GNAT superfamily N-acetyltransferase
MPTRRAASPPEAGEASKFTVKPLEKSTWAAFAALVERHNGVWGGCWCMAFHDNAARRRKFSTQQLRAQKEQRVCEGNAHAALVFDGKTCIGWCQFGSTDELPAIHHRRAYEEGLKSLPDWRITCFFIDKAYRGRGVARLALQGAVQEIRHLGGGVIESYPEDATDRKVSSAFLFNGEMAMFEREGFKRLRRIGKDAWVVAKRVRKG